ncbi:hypothetical protein SPI_07385 [Niveomyces insectorum RCEF 264]|uniref:Uncharacterized protein n=1 Tax=Niveomyces insectorum RCEF 264 TaxID=1081102 RepID=A0A167PTB7_9HYPO|nr:hypothetical protein SPI_07385 [Niveomyces insectorum RCEF 264]
MATDIFGDSMSDLSFFSVSPGAKSLWNDDGPTEMEIDFAADDNFCPNLMPDQPLDGILDWEAADQNQRDMDIIFDNTFQSILESDSNTFETSKATTPPEADMNDGVAVDEPQTSSAERSAAFGLSFQQLQNLSGHTAPSMSEGGPTILKAHKQNELRQCLHENEAASSQPEANKGNEMRLVVSSARPSQERVYGALAHSVVDSRQGTNSWQRPISQATRPTGRKLPRRKGPQHRLSVLTTIPEETVPCPQMPVRFTVDVDGRAFAETSGVVEEEPTPMAKKTQGGPPPECGMQWPYASDDEDAEKDDCLIMGDLPPIRFAWGAVVVLPDLNEVSGTHPFDGLWRRYRGVRTVRTLTARSADLQDGGLDDSGDDWYSDPHTVVKNLYPAPKTRHPGDAASEIEKLVKERRKRPTASTQHLVRRVASPRPLFFGEVGTLTPDVINRSLALRTNKMSSSFGIKKKPWDGWQARARMEKT